jgi:outer membrane protein TolC
MSEAVRLSRRAFSRPARALVLILTAACAAAPPAHRLRVDDWERQARARAESMRPTLGEDAALVDLLRFARLNNPGLAAAFERWREALERVPQATKLPEPHLTLGAFLAEVETRVGPMQGRVGLTQAFPWFGTLDEAGGVAFQASEAARVQLEGARLMVDRDVRDAWYEYAWLESAVEITRGHQDLLLHWESVARARMETGLGKHADVIRAQVELGKLEDRVRTLADLRLPVRARLNAALGRASGAPLPVPSLSADDFATPDAAELREALGQSNPELLALEHQIEGARHALALADKRRYPAFSIGAEYTLIGRARLPGMRGSGDDAVALTLGLALPLWQSAYDAGEREAEARLRRTHAQHQETWNRLASELELSLYHLRDADRRVRLFEESLIPKGEQSVQALDTAYQAGEQGFLDLIDAQRLLLEFQLEVARARSDRARALAETERISGVPLHSEL